MAPFRRRLVGHGWQRATLAQQRVARSRQGRLQVGIGRDWMNIKCTIFDYHERRTGGQAGTARA